MKNKILDTIKNGCTIFSIITVISYTIGMILSTADKAYIPKLKTIYIYLFFSILFAFANNILSNKKINLTLKLTLHFLVSCALFFCIAIIGGGLTNSGFATIILMFTFIIAYILFAIIYLITNKKKETKKNNDENYSSLFK